MVKNRFQYKKIVDGDIASCWYCGEDTFFCLIDNFEGSEVWCCEKDALRVGKIKKLRNRSKKQRKAILESNSLIKKQEKGILLEGLK